MLLEVFDADSDFDINCQDGCVPRPIAGTSAHHSQFGQHTYVIREAPLRGIDLPWPVQHFILRTPAKTYTENPWLTNSE